MPTISTDFDQDLSARLSAAVQTHGRLATRRVATCFYNLGIQTAQDIGKHTRYEFARVPNCGRKSLELIDALAEEAGVLLENGGPSWAPDPMPNANRSLFAEALERFKQAYDAGTGIVMTSTEVAAGGSLLLLAAQIRDLPVAIDH